MLKRESRTHLGDKIREVREKKGITLRTLAREAGVSESLISQIERNRVSPSIDTLLTIADILDIDMEYLFQDLRKKRKVSIVHRDERNRIQLGGVTYQQLSIIADDDEHAIEAFLLEIAPGGEKGSREYGHAGKEMGFIIEGSGELQYGRDVIEVGEGDSISFSSDSPHILKNTGAGKLAALWIITPPKMLFGKS